MLFLFFGDWHITDKDDLIYFKGHLKLMRWLEEQYNLSNTIFIQAGDLFDKDVIHHEDVMSPTIDFLLKFKECHLIQGNHDKDKKGSILAPLSKHLSLNVYSSFQETLIDSFSFGMFPHFYDYEDNHLYEDNETIYDFRVIHRHPKGFNAGKEETAFKVHAKYATFYGHYHEPKGEAIGIPQTTREGEQNWKKRFFEFDTETEILTEREAPVFFTIQTISYGEKIYNKDYLYNVIEAPSKKVVKEKYPDVKIRRNGIKLIDRKKDSTEIRLEGSKKLKLNNFYDKWKNEFGDTVRGEVLDELELQFQRTSGNRDIR